MDRWTDEDGGVAAAGTSRRRGPRRGFRFERGIAALGVLLCAWAAPGAAAAGAAGDAEDVAGARAVFERNLDAIRNRDLEAYLSTYLATPALVRTGVAGPQLGFEAHAAQAAAGPWPDVFEAMAMRLTPVAPGVVYGTYRYRVRYGEQEDRGISERVFVRTPAGWKIAVTTAFSTLQAPPPRRALVGATLWTGSDGEPVRDAVVVVDNGRIACAGGRETCPVPEGMEVVDLSGLWILPGLVDAHVHLAQTGWADGRPDALDVRDAYPYAQVQAELRAHPERWFRAYLCAGVTTVFDVGGYPWSWDLRARAEDDPLAPHVAAAGPLLSTWDFWLNLPAERQFIYLEDAEAARAGVRYLAAQGTDAVKIWFIRAPGRSMDAMARAVTAAGEEAGRLGLPLIVHATGLEEAKIALRAGARLLVHSVQDQPVDDEFLELAGANGTFYCPTLTVLDGYRRLFASAVHGKIPEVDDPLGCADPEILRRIRRTPELGAGKVDPERFQRRSAGYAELRPVMEENLRRVYRAGIPVVAGTDAGNPLTLHGTSIFAELEAMQAAGMPPEAVLRAATVLGGRLLGRDDVGRIAPGAQADLIVVGADPLLDVAALRDLRWVMRRGELRGAFELRPAAAAD